VVLLHAVPKLLDAPLVVLQLLELLLVHEFGEPYLFLHELQVAFCLQPPLLPLLLHLLQ
jgi:hypothetical protein